jgi:5'-nucleotidase
MANMMEIEPIALFDMDGTLCDYDKGLFDVLESVRSPSEPVFHPPLADDASDYIKKRADLIRASASWWENLGKFKLGWDILDVARTLGYRNMILTQGPRKNPESWSGKKRWIDRNLGENADITITRDKGLVYGKVLVDDFPRYIERWLSWRERGLVIMPAHESNRDYRHPNVIRYDGANLDIVAKAMGIAKDRKRGEPLILK